MKDYIERYVFDVARRLPEKSREEVKKELRANINDMLSDKPTEEEIKQVLLSLGSPRKLASNYREKQRYLISPEWMDDYLFVLKIVAIVAGAVTFVTALITVVLHPEGDNTFEQIFNSLFRVIGNTAQSLMFSFAMVTFIFAIIQYFNEKGLKHTWKVESLPAVPKDNDIKIPAKKTIAGLIVTVIFGSLFIYIMAKNATFIGWYNSGDGWTLTQPLLNGDIVKLFLPFFVISLLIDIASQLVKLKEQRWSLLVATVYSIAKIVSLALLILFISQPNLINDAFIQQVVDNTDFTFNQIKDGFKTGFIVIGILAGVGNVADLIKTWFKVGKNINKEA